MLQSKMMEDNNLNIKSSDYILLTGAGFTKNFGAYLANEMWSKIFNNKKIQTKPKIKELMRNKFDYESIYYSIMEGSYTIDEKKAINNAVKDAYEDIDTIIRSYNSKIKYDRKVNIDGSIQDYDSLTYNSFPSELDNFMELIKYFDKNDDKRFIFTLNQDLFFERQCYGVELSIPGIKNDSKWFTSNFTEELMISDYCPLPNKEELNRKKQDILSEGNFFIIKLHGSYNWKSFDDSPKMVIGRGKTEQIQKEPLLKYYFEIFKEVLLKKSKRLLIIGYGFGDDHINGIIAEAVIDYGLKIFVISPSSPKKFKDKLIQETFGEEIWQGIAGYFPYKLTEIYSENSSIKTQASKDLFNTFFDDPKLLYM